MDGIPLMEGSGNGNVDGKGCAVVLEGAVDGAVDALGRAVAVGRAAVVGGKGGVVPSGGTVPRADSVVVPVPAVVSTVGTVVTGVVAVGPLAPTPPSSPRKWTTANATTTPTPRRSGTASHHHLRPSDGAAAVLRRSLPTCPLP